ncbi:MAG: sigma-70 family RNA polymerase sigma factor [Anaerolineales bacterium]|nr:sigma-70 family RNA polymerase sigma factor [Anaerolineales bacterium]
MEISFAVEQDLIRRARLGDQAAFEQLIAGLTPDLFRVARRMTADTDRAEAVVQETFWRAWQALPRYSETRRFLPYLITIAANLVRDTWRRERRLLSDERDQVADLPDGRPTPERQVEGAELAQALAQAVEELPPAYRAVIALRYDAGLPYEQIAAALDLPVNTVRTHLHRAKAALRARLEALDGQAG